MCVWPLSYSQLPDSNTPPYWYNGAAALRHIHANQHQGQPLRSANRHQSPAVNPRSKANASLKLSCVWWIASAVPSSATSSSFNRASILRSCRCRSGDQPAAEDSSASSSWSRALRPKRSTTCTAARHIPECLAECLSSTSEEMRTRDLNASLPESRMEGVSGRPLAIHSAVRSAETHPHSASHSATACSSQSQYLCSTALLIPRTASSLANIKGWWPHSLLPLCEHKRPQTCVWRPALQPQRYRVGDLSKTTNKRLIAVAPAKACTCGCTHEHSRKQHSNYSIRNSTEAHASAGG